ncbi:MAG: DUF3078 domain-containing protein [Candidatus Cloacimonetes bacterium]|nr:DUF3078 domain-containing protein [Candidatus Cloacimonadota bacterium]
MNKAFYLNLIVIFITSSTLIAEPWKITSDASISLSQSSYSDNWAGTELGSISWTASSNSAAEKQLSDIMHNRTTLKLSFGQTHQQRITDEGDKDWSKPEKSNDKIDLESLLRFTLQVYVDPFIAARWESQFLDLSDPTKTRIINPSRFTESAGIMRNFIKEDDHSLSARLGAAFRQNVDRDALVNDTRETVTTNDGGIQFIAEYMRRFLPQDILYNSRLEVYQALFNSEEDELPNDNWKAVDVLWQHSLSTKIWSIINAGLFFEMVYDKEQVDELQFRQTLGLGVFFQLY